MTIAFLGAICVRYLFHEITNFTFDDAFITYRYAENLAAGLGFVYNAGERVLGTTTPLFTLLLSSASILGLPVPAAALAITLTASGITAALLLRFATLAGFERLSFVPVIVYVFFPRLLPIDTGGMETTLFTLMATAAFYFQQRQLPVKAIGLAAAATLVRPEGLLILFVLIAFLALKEVRLALVATLTALLILLPWVIFAWLYFGSPVANSIGAKLALYYRVWASPAWDNFLFIMGLHNPLGCVLFFLALVGGFWLLARRRFGYLESIWMLISIMSLTFSSVLIFRWYVAPIYPIYILFASATLPALVGRWQRLRRLISPAGRLLTAAAMIAALAAANYSTVINYRHEWDFLSGIQSEIVEYLQANADPLDVVATEDLGYVGYYSGFRMLDRAGLISPEAIPFNRRGDYMGLIMAVRPEWLVISPWDPTSQFLDSSGFRLAYEYRKTVASPLGDTWSFNVYRRIDRGR